MCSTAYSPVPSDAARCNCLESGVPVARATASIICGSTGPWLHSTVVVALRRRLATIFVTASPPSWYPSWLICGFSRTSSPVTRAVGPIVRRHRSAVEEISLLGRYAAIPGATLSA